MKKMVFAMMLLSSSLVAEANVLSFEGSLNRATNIMRFDFNLASDSTVNFTTLGYAGGINGNGATIPDGGFDPEIGLFHVFSGFGNPLFYPYNFIFGSADDGRNVTSASTGFSYDAFLSKNLLAGNYTLLLGQYQMNWGGYADPYIHSNSLPFDKSSKAINHWALDISSKSLLTVTQVTQIPEPSTYAMLLAGLGLFGLTFIRKSKV